MDRDIYKGRIFTVREETHELPNGHRETLDLVRHGGAAAVVAVDAQARICLLRQYRVAVDEWLWEVPAGRREPDEPPETTAQRELAEEAGLQAAQWEALGPILPTPGFCDERIHLYLAQDLKPAPLAREPGEIIEVHWMTLAEAEAAIHAGDLMDGKTQCALYRYRLWCSAATR